MVRTAGKSADIAEKMSLLSEKQLFKKAGKGFAMCEDAKKEMEQLIQEIRTMLEEDADIKKLFIRKTGAGPQVEIAGVGKVSLEEAEKLGGKDVRWSRGESGSSSKYLEQLDNLSENKINHMIDGSKNSNHGWEKVVPDKNWSDIKNIIADVMDTGVEGPYKSVFSKKATINGFEVEVTYTKLSDGTIKISDAWINQ